MQTQTKVRALLRQTQEVNARGNKVYRLFLPSERYDIDFADDFHDEGWGQYDTDQDAHYFGVWVNDTKLYTLTYAEGDWTLVVCPDDEHYNAELMDANKFYGEGYEYKTVDGAGHLTIYRQDRAKFLTSKAKNGG